MRRLDDERGAVLVVKVSATFTASDGRAIALPVPGRLERASLGEVGPGDVIILPDLTVVEVAAGLFFGDEDDPHTDPPGGDYSSKITVPAKDGSRHRVPYRTEVWRITRG